MNGRERLLRSEQLVSELDRLAKTVSRQDWFDAIDIVSFHNFGPDPPPTGDTRLDRIMGVFEDGDTVGQVAEKLGWQSEPTRQAMERARVSGTLRKERIPGDPRGTYRWLRSVST